MGHKRFLRCTLLGLAACVFMSEDPGAQPLAQNGVNRKTERIAVLGALPPLTDEKDAKATVAVLKKVGYTPVILSAEQVADKATFHRQAFDLLIVPHVPLFPTIAQQNLRVFLEADGRLLCIGGPPFARLAVKKGDIWRREPEGKQNLLALATLSPAKQGVFVGSQLAGAWVPIPRHRGLGLSGTRPGRMLSADPRGDEEGYGRESQGKQWVYLPLNGAMKGALWGGTVKPEHPGEPTFTPLVPIVERLLQNVFLAQAGSDKPGYFTDEPVVVGARLINLSKKPQRVAGEIEVRAVGATPAVVNGLREFEATPAPGQEEVTTFDFPTLSPGEYSVRTTLFAADGKQGDERAVLDRITAPFHVLPAQYEARPEDFVRVQGEAFVLNGKPWRPVGVHYWPRWTAGQEAAEFKEGWLSPAQYDPILVERDLETCVSLGINLLSIRYTASAQAPALNDFLARCRNRRIKVNVILANVTPLTFDATLTHALLNAARLRGNPAVFALMFTSQPSYEMEPERVRQIADLLREEGFPVSARYSSAKPLDFAVRRLPPFTGAGDASDSKGRPFLFDTGSPFGAAPTPERLKAQAEVMDQSLQLARRLKANGILIWRFPGGLLPGDTMDFGIVGADGIPRPAAQIIGRWALGVGR